MCPSAIQDLRTGTLGPHGRRGAESVLPDGVNDDKVVHHDNDPGEAAQDEYEGDHDEDQGQPLFTRTDQLFIILVV